MDSSKDDKEEENDDEEDDLEKGEDDEEEEEGEEDIEEDMGEDTEVDICSLPLKTGNCKAGVERYFFDLDKNECLKFSYRGCDKNANNFETMRDCEIKCIISKKGSKSSREK
uniref:Trypsin inhibitor n=1 Tax=Lepeophtheirus salmonis TaxID=72036 RepID=C1BSZ0_LEPSM|nr:Trypsin inhibitor [Lepeophtheirus salmonis]